MARHQKTNRRSQRSNTLDRNRRARKHAAAAGNAIKIIMSACKLSRDLDQLAPKLNDTDRTRVTTLARMLRRIHMYLDTTPSIRAQFLEPETGETPTWVEVPDTTKPPTPVRDDKLWGPLSLDLVYQLAGPTPSELPEGTFFGAALALVDPRGRVYIYWPDVIEALANTVVVTQQEGETVQSLSALAWVTEQQAKPLEQRHVIVTGTLKNRTEGRDDRPLNRTPAVVDIALLSPLEVVQVDGVPFASMTATANTAQYQRIPAPAISEQQSFAFPGPKSLGGHEVNDVVIQALASLPLTDLRNPLMGDVARLMTLAYALTGPTMIHESNGARFLGRNDTPANRRRWWCTCAAVDSIQLIINAATGQWIKLARADPDGAGNVYLAAPAWWRGKGPGQAWRWSGTLWRPPLIGTSQSGGSAGFWSGVDRTLNGLEALLAWSSTPGRGKGARIPDALQPERRDGAGPGRPIWVPWRDLLTLAGEPVAQDEDPKGTAGRRYRRRLEALEDRGYCTEIASTAHAGDTVEILKNRSGWHPNGAGIWIRASDRFVEAVRRGQKTRNWEHISPMCLFEP